LQLILFIGLNPVCTKSAAPGSIETAGSENEKQQMSLPVLQTVRNIVNQYIKADYTANLCAVDLSKAF